MKSTKLVRILGVAAIMGATAFIGNGNILGLEGNTTVVSADTYYDALTSTDGNWKFTLDGIICGYLGNQKEVTIPTSLSADGKQYVIKGISWGSLSYSDTIEVINIPAEIVEIPSSSFTKNPSLREINVSEDNKKFSSIQGVLYNKAQTTLMKVPSNTINGALILPDTLTSMNVHAIEENHKITYLSVPASYQGALNGTVGIDKLKALEHIDINAENPKYKAVNGVLHDKALKNLMLYPPCKREQSYELLPSVECLYDKSFVNVKNLKNISFTKKLVKMSYGTFTGTEITSINHVTTREEYNAMDKDIKLNIQRNLNELEGLPIITSLVEQEVDYAIATCLSEPNMNIYQKIKALYNYAANKVEYDFDEKSHSANHCAPSLFLRDKTVCEGYALAMKLLLDKAGIQNEMVVTDRGTGEEGHAWNVVNIDGDWLHIDATWDDMDDEDTPTGITWFLRTSEEYENTYHRVDYYVDNSKLTKYSWAVTDQTPYGTKIECNKLFGDIDKDGQLTIDDVRAMRDEVRAYEYYAYMNYYNITADMNRDGAIDMEDYNILNDLVNAQPAE